jgi:hypothetical protein
MPQEPKRPVYELKPADLRTFVGNIECLLWLDFDTGPKSGNRDPAVESHSANGLVGNTRSIISARKSDRLRSGSRADSVR